jgi:hypothetical protein
LPRITLKDLGKGWILAVDTEDLEKICPLAGKKHIDLIKDDVTAGKDLTGYAQYRKILEAHGILSSAELNEWRQKLTIAEKSAPF